MEHSTDRPSKTANNFEIPLRTWDTNVWFYKDLVIPESWIEDEGLDCDRRVVPVPDMTGWYTEEKIMKPRTKKWWDDVYYEATRSLVIGV